jgi:hypothetical protein
MRHTDFTLRKNFYSLSKSEFDKASATAASKKELFFKELGQRGVLNIASYKQNVRRSSMNMLNPVMQEVYLKVLPEFEHFYVPFMEVLSDSHPHTRFSILLDFFIHTVAFELIEDLSSSDPEKTSSQASSSSSSSSSTTSKYDFIYPLYEEFERQILLFSDENKLLKEIECIHLDDSIKECLNANQLQSVVVWHRLRSRANMDAKLSSSFESYLSEKDKHSHNKRDPLEAVCSYKLDSTRLSISWSEFIIRRIVFSFTHPRLDTGVTLQDSHLLKSPFSVHPSTGAIALPFKTEISTVYSPIEAKKTYQAMRIAGMVTTDNFRLSSRMKHDGLEFIPNTVLKMALKYIKSIPASPKYESDSIIAQWKKILFN